MAKLLANKYVQQFLMWVMNKFILPYLKDKALDTALDVRVKLALLEYDKKYKKLEEEYDELKAKNLLTEAEVVRIRNEKIELETELWNAGKR